VLINFYIFLANNTTSKPSHRFIPSDDEEEEEEEEEEEDESDDDDEEESTINHKVVSKPIVANKPKSSNQATMTIKSKNKGKAPSRIPQPSDDEEEDDDDDDENSVEEKNTGMYSTRGKMYQTILNKEINSTRRPTDVCSSHVYIKTT
jgi:hypothetical protein